MKIGEKIIYGNEIECVFETYELSGKNGDIIIHAVITDGMKIIAPLEMFKEIRIK